MSLQQTKNKLKWAKKQKAYAWAMFYKQIEENHEAELSHYNHIQAIQAVPVAIKNLPQNLVNEFAEMSIELKKKLDCPICLEVIEKGELTITGCGHKYCKNCRKNIDVCAICRKKIKN
tara:strand:- start:450 stop:803 length:354 start_codon:yes stop_codon:yes gene_type:complete